MFKSPFSTVPIPFSLNSLPLLQLPPFHPSVNTFFLLQFSFSLLFQAPYSLIPALSLPISRRFWEWGCPNHGDVHITVTPLVSTLSFLNVYLSISQLPDHFWPQIVFGNNYTSVTYLSEACEVFIRLLWNCSRNSFTLSKKKKVIKFNS